MIFLFTTFHLFCSIGFSQKPNQLFMRSQKSTKSERKNELNKYTAQELYDLAQHNLEKNNHTKALEHFTTLRNYFRDDPLSIEAELGIAEVYKDRGDYDLARFAFDDFRKLHPRHPKLDYVDFQVGMMQYQKASRRAGRDQSWTQSALSFWDNYEYRYPNSSYKEEVLEIRQIAINRMAKREYQIAMFYKKRKAWESVRRRSEFLIRNYPDSEYKQKALLLLVEAYSWQNRDEEAQLIIETLGATSEELSGEAQKKQSLIQKKRE